MCNSSTIRTLEYNEDHYDGVTIDVSTVAPSPTEFSEQLELLETLLEKKKLLWIRVPITHALLIPVLTQRGFFFHHCDETEIMLVKKLVEKPVIPTAKNFSVGVGAVVLDNNQLLIIKNKHYGSYMLPGGHIDKNETIKEALSREVFEETGVRVTFESIINIGHFTKGQFGEANLYIVCRAKAHSKHIEIHDVSEIIEAKWIDVEEYVASGETNAYNREVVRAALLTKSQGLSEKQLTLKVPCTYEVFI